MLNHHLTEKIRLLHSEPTMYIMLSEKQEKKKYVSQLSRTQNWKQLYNAATETREKQTKNHQGDR